MSLETSLERQLENPHLNIDQRAQLRCQLAKELEETGSYEAARGVMSELWRSIGERPSLEGLDQSTAAEVLLRAGTLTGWIGNANQIEGAQETAKNLISESSNIFESLSYTKKALEAQTELAYCYWREGAFDEARIILKGVVSQLTTDNELKAKAVLRSAIVERGATQFKDALRILTDFAPLFDRITNHSIKGGYHNELAIVLRNLGTSEKREDYLDRAFVEYTAASYHFEQAGHKFYRANVENNLGFLYFNSGRFKEAHEHLEHARRILTNLKDGGTVAQVDETRARVFLAEGHNSEAEKAARLAVRTLEKGDRQALLAEALITHGTALARLGLYDQARLTLQRAIEAAQQAGALDEAAMAALTSLEELGAHLNVDEMQNIYRYADQWLSRSKDTQILHRLRKVAGRLLTATHAYKAVEVESSAAALRTEALPEMMLKYENNIIRQALLTTQGSVTRAARLLGVSHQSLTYILQNRHRDLLTIRTPIQRRRKSIIRKFK